MENFIQMPDNCSRDVKKLRSFITPFITTPATSITSASGRKRILKCEFRNWLVKRLLSTQSGHSYQMLKRQLSSVSGHLAINIDLLVSAKSGRLLFYYQEGCLNS